MFYPGFNTLTPTGTSGASFDTASFRREFRRLSQYWTRDRAAREAVSRCGAKPGLVVEDDDTRTSSIQILDDAGNVAETVLLDNW
jgi:hypothetical protein